MHLHYRVYQALDFLEVSKQEAELLKLLKRNVLEIDSTYILPHAVRKQLVHHAIYIRHAADIVSKML